MATLGHGPLYGFLRWAHCFLVSVIKHSARDNLQVVFVISYHSTEKGGDRVGFVSLLRHATTFIKDLKKYKDSVALVVTKVSSTFVLVSGHCYVSN